MRQEIVRKEIEAKAEKERKENEKRELIQSLESDKIEAKIVTPKQNLTPLISPAALIPPKFPKTIGPVSNMLAIERAKQKVMELKAQKMAQHQQFMPKPTVSQNIMPKPTVAQTIAQTTPKGAGRVAHTNVVPQVNISFQNAIHLEILRII